MHSKLAQNRYGVSKKRRILCWFQIVRYFWFWLLKWLEEYVKYNFADYSQQGYKMISFKFFAPFWKINNIVCIIFSTSWNIFAIFLQMHKWPVLMLGLTVTLPFQPLRPRIFCSTDSCLSNTWRKVYSAWSDKPLRGLERDSLTRFVWISNDYRILKFDQGMGNTLLASEESVIFFSLPLMQTDTSPFCLRKRGSLTKQNLSF